MEILYPVLMGTILWFQIRFATNSTDIILFNLILTIDLSVAVFIFACLFILNQMSNDKETKMKETMRIMGLDRGAYAFSYLLNEGIMALFAALVAASLIWLGI